MAERLHPGAGGRGDEMAETLNADLGEDGFVELTPR
jgi:hypothetical protein